MTDSLKIFFTFFVCLSFVTPLSALPVTLEEHFNSDPGWSKEGSLTKTVSGGQMQIVTPNLGIGRVIMPFSLLGNFTVIVTGNTSDSGSYLSTHVHHYVGVYHQGSTSNKTYQLTEGFSDESIGFGSDTHYTVDIGQELGANVTFDLKFERSGNFIKTYRKSGSTYQLLQQYSLQNTMASLYFEFAELDGTSSGSGYANYSYLLYQGDDGAPLVPEASSFLCLGLAALIGFFRLSSRKSRQ